MPFSFALDGRFVDASYRIGLMLLAHTGLRILTKNLNDRRTEGQNEVGEMQYVKYSLLERQPFVVFVVLLRSFHCY